MNIIEYKLKFLLNSLTLKIHKIEDLTDSKKMLEFNSAYCDTKKIQAFCSEISNNTKFPMLNVPLHSSDTMHRVLFCEVAVGNSLFVSNDYADNLDIPTGIDSLIVNGSNNVGYVTENNSDIKKCAYVIKDRRQILPLYEVSFEYDEEFERKSRNRNICHRCVDKEAVVFCPSERASFCDICDKEVHCDSFHGRHERKYFRDVGQKKFVCCMYHPAKVVEYFCDECSESICTECQISGRHSTLEFSKHKIHPFLDACKTASETIKAGDPEIIGNVDKVDGALLKHAEAMTFFKDNVSSCRKQIERELNKLLLQLDAIESKKRQVYNALFVERLQKKEYLRQMVAYPHALDPADLLFGYRNILDQRKSSEPPVYEPLSLEKIELHGKLTVGIPKEPALRTTTNKSEDQVVGWRVETMNLVGRNNGNY